MNSNKQKIIASAIKIQKILYYVDMHREIEIALEVEKAKKFCRRLVENKHVISLAIFRGAWAKPKGDLVVGARALNCGADGVLREVQKLTGGKNVSISSSQSPALINESQNEQIKKDLSDLGRNGNWASPSRSLYDQLRCADGLRRPKCRCRIGLTKRLLGTIAFIAASIIAPGANLRSKLRN